MSAKDDVATEPTAEDVTAALDALGFSARCALSVDRVSVSDLRTDLRAVLVADRERRRRRGVDAARLPGRAEHAVRSDGRQTLCARLVGVLLVAKDGARPSCLQCRRALRALAPGGRAPAGEGDFQ